MIPRPAPAVVAFIKSLGITALGGRVSTQLSQTLPACRITLLYDLDPSEDWERTPVFQVEVWATDDAIADEIANEIYNRWRSFRGQYGQAYVSGAWPHSGGPRPLPDQTTNLKRAQFEAALRIHGAQT